MTAPAEIVELVKRFVRNEDAYRSAYNETQLRVEFVDPFFQCLGWDIENKQGFAEAYKDVIHEDQIKVGGATKAPDYCFRIGGTRKFFLEAKRPSVHVKTDSDPAFQLRRYAWSAKLPLSILTNFAELAVYDCRVKPDQSDKASTARTNFLIYQEYPDKWDELAGTFSRDAVLKGYFDKFAETKKGKRGTATVDAAFLEEIESWRDTLARNFAARNKKLDQRQLNYAVQATIDRILFLRMCEDRGIEPYGQLQRLRDSENTYKALFTLFQRADDRYNSGLFHFEKDPARPDAAPDTLTSNLKLDDKPLKDILKNLYYPDSPYEFSVLPAEILGHVYEQFLGKVIRLTAGHQAKIEDKPEVKKAGGVYYTPTYIVDYIVKHTVGKLLGDPPAPTTKTNGAPGASATRVAGITPRDAAKLRILDPSCGSGSFLLGAYQYLLNWHRDWYVADDPAKHTKETYQGAGGFWRLTSAEKKRILLNNIYGVDIDAQAVEVTKLSLLLKVLEDENEQTIKAQMRLFHERALPDLASNIKCGNSLIGTDFYEGQLEMFDEGEKYRINVFDWNAEFPKIMKAGGFDAVIGNPPWGQKAIDEGEAVKRYVWSAFPSSAGIFDLFRPFVERGIRLVKKGGAFGMVLPDIVLLKDYPETRRFLLNELSLARIDWWGMAFSAAVIDAATVIGSKTPAGESHQVCATVHDAEAPSCQSIPQTDFLNNPRFVFNLYLTQENRQILTRLQQGTVLSEYFEIHEGVHSGNIRDELFLQTRIDDTCRELYFGRGEIVPYFLHWEGRFIRLAAVPNTKTRARYANLGKPEWHERPKLLVRRTGDYVLAAVDHSGRYASNNFFLVFPKRDYVLDLDCICALLNSRFMTWYFRTIEPRKGRVFAELKIKHIETFPLPDCFPDTRDLNRLASKRSALTAKKFATAKTPDEQARLQRQIDATDRQIDRLVYELYGLTEEEIAIVEGAN